MLNDILQSTKQSLTDRLSSPLIGAFVISWCVWNWKFLVILFSNASVTSTFSLIERISFPDLSSVLLHGLLFPLLTALVYVFIYPYPARYIYEFSLHRQREINQVKQRIAEETPLTLEESRRLRSEYIENERKHATEIQNLNEEIARLNASLGLQGKNEQPLPLSSSERLYNDLETTQLALLELLERKGGEAPEQELIEQSSETRVKAEFDLGELERRQLVTRKYNSRAEAYLIKFTHEGRRSLLKSKQDSAA